MPSPYTYTIDIDTGIMSSLVGNNPSQKHLKDQVKQIKIPFWKKIKENVMILHQHLPTIPLIGWDIAITDDGFFILEGNQNPSLDIHQVNPYTPFIGTGFYKTLLNSLNNKLSK